MSRSVSCLVVWPLAALAALFAVQQVSAQEAPPAATSSTAASAAASSSAASVVPDLGTRRSGDDWPAFLGPTGDSKSRERGIITRWPAGGPPIVWQRKLSGGYSMPVISRGRLFQFDRIDKQATLTCLNSETGKEMWNFAYPTDYEDMLGYDNGPRCCPVVDDDRVYIFGSEGMLHCLGVVDGRVHWKLDTAKQFHVHQNFFGVGSTPVIEGSLLIAQIGGSPADNELPSPERLDAARGNGSGIVAFDKLTGEVKYQITDELASYAGPVLATIGGRRWCFVFARGGLVAFEPASGKIDFDFPWRARDVFSVNASNPVVIGDKVLISETYEIGSTMLRVKPGGYDIVWQDSKKRLAKSLQTHWNTPIHHEGYIYGSSGRHTENAELRAVEAATGAVAWSEPGLTRCSLLYVDGHFVNLAENGRLSLIKATPSKYEEVAAAMLVDRTATERVPGLGPPQLVRYPAWAAPILSHGLLYIRGRDRLVCLELIPLKK